MCHNAHCLWDEMLFGVLVNIYNHCWMLHADIMWHKQHLNVAHHNDTVVVIIFVVCWHWQRTFQFRFLTLTCVDTVSSIRYFPLFIFSLIFSFNLHFMLVVNWNVIFVSWMWLLCLGSIKSRTKKFHMKIQDKQ